MVNNSYITHLQPTHNERAHLSRRPTLLLSISRPNGARVTLDFVLLRVGGIELSGINVYVMRHDYIY